LSQPPATLLCFDYGERRIGVAVGQTLTGTATPLETLPARDGNPDWDRVATLVAEWQPDALVVGLPLNMDDTEQELTARARRFGNRLHGRLGLTVHFADERLSTREARDRERQADLVAGHEYDRHGAQTLDGHERDDHPGRASYVLRLVRGEPGRAHGREERVVHELHEPNHAGHPRRRREMHREQRRDPVAHRIVGERRRSIDPSRPVAIRAVPPSGTQRRRLNARVITSNTEPVVVPEYCGYSGRQTMRCAPSW